MFQTELEHITYVEVVASLERSIFRWTPKRNLMLSCMNPKLKVIDTRDMSVSPGAKDALKPYEEGGNDPS